MKTEKATRRDVNIENIKRWHAEIPLFNALPSIDSLGLIRVPLQATDRNDHSHTGLDSEKTYLVCENGAWFMGKFTKSPLGWRIDHGWTHSGAGALDIIYEVHGLPNTPKRLIERLPLPPYENDDN